MKKFDKKKSIRHILTEPGQSAFKRYKALVTGDVSFIQLCLTELVFSTLGWLPGALGILLRRLLYPFLLKSCARGVIIGRNCVFRHPSKISIGENVTIDDNCVLDARGTEERGLEIASSVIISRGTLIQSKSGDISIGQSVNIGANSMLVSWDGIEIQEGAALAAGCYLSAGSFETIKLEKPITELEAYTNGPIVVQANVWIATRVTILDGVTIGKGCIVGSGAIVRENLPDYTVAIPHQRLVMLPRQPTERTT